MLVSCIALATVGIAVVILGLIVAVKIVRTGTEFDQKFD